MEKNPLDSKKSEFPKNVPLGERDAKGFPLFATDFGDGMLIPKASENKDEPMEFFEEKK